MSNKELYSTYDRVKKNCAQDWENSKSFYAWYHLTAGKQKSCCKYCGLPGDTKKYYGKHFREGRRGKRLEVDRIDNNKPYSSDNCVLACYPCNNAKSDVFSSQEFEKIAKTIREVKTK
jgi:5-methylcytosine-specific restriction endonuclease McrA